MRVEADKRSRHVEPAPDAERAAREAHRALARAEAKAARALATIERCRSYLLQGLPSAQAWARKVGYGPLQVRRLMALGRTLIDEPDLEDKVARGDVPAETAAQIGRVMRDPKVELDEQQKAEWKRKAENDDPNRVRDEAEQAVEDAHQGAPTLPLRFRVTKKTRDGFRRVRLLMADGQRVMPTDGEVLGRMVQDWLLRHDPRLKPLPKRRTRRRTRDVPKRVQAIVKRRSGGLCEICRHRRGRELVHLKPFAEGGGNEADNLAHGCRDCHVLLDAGVFRFTHFDEAGRPVFGFDHERFETVSARDGASCVRERPPAYGASRRLRPATMATGPP